MQNTKNNFAKAATLKANATQSQFAAKAQLSFIAKYKHGIIAIAILAAIPAALVIAKSCFGLDINLNDM